MAAINQAQLNALFEHYDISFRNPEDFVRKLLRMLRNYHNAPWNLSEEDFRYYLRNSNCLRLYDLLQTIRNLPQHRHRIDADNVLDQFRIRANRLPGQTALVPTPMEPDYNGNDRVGAAEVAEADLQLAELQAMVQANGDELLWNPEMNLPIPTLRTSIAPRAYIRHVPQTNENAMDLIVQGRASSQAARDAVLDILSADPPPSMILPPLLLDNPLETCLEMPEDCRFLNDPTPVSRYMDNILNQNANDLLIWDYRIGEKHEIDPLGTEHYIYQLISMIRDVIRQPEIARAYAIIFRAYPLRYAAGSADEIADEGPPTAAESR